MVRSFGFNLCGFSALDFSTYSPTTESSLSAASL